MSGEKVYTTERTKIRHHEFRIETIESTVSDVNALQMFLRVTAHTITATLRCSACGMFKSKLLDFFAGVSLFRALQNLLRSGVRTPRTAPVTPCELFAEYTSAKPPLPTNFVMRQTSVNNPMQVEICGQRLTPRQLALNLRFDTKEYLAT